MTKIDFGSFGIEELLEAQKEIAIQAESKLEEAKKQGASAEALELMRAELTELEEKFNDTLAGMQLKIFELENREPAVKYLQINDLPKIDITGKHEEFETLMKACIKRRNVALIGEAGSGKTYSAELVARELNLEFSSLSVGATTGKHEFFGYMDANGNFVETEFYKRFTQGGIFLIDELDAGNAGVLTAINSALANHQCAFANGMQEKHEDFICIATANTFGNGATMEYIGRNALDKATLDRFLFLEWNIDENLERQISTDSELCTLVQKIRKIVKDNKIKHLVTTRGLQNLEELISAGIDREKALKMAIFKGMSETEVTIIKNNL